MIHSCTNKFLKLWNKFELRKAWNYENHFRSNDGKENYKKEEKFLLRDKFQKAYFSAYFYLVKYPSK